MMKLCACAWNVLAALAAAAAVLPGYLTDPTAGLQEQDEGASLPPEHLRFPYVSTYYVKPVVTTAEEVKIRLYVTDFEQSEIRFLDKSKKFAVCAEYGLDGADGVRVKPMAATAGDTEVSLGRLAAGDYWVQVWAVDVKRRESHRVLHRFRVIEPGSDAIRPDQTYRMTEADLAAYGLRNDGAIHRFQTVVVKPPAKDEKFAAAVARVRGEIDAWAKEHDVRAGGKRPGYTVLAPVSKEGARPYKHAYQSARIVYDEGYDAEAVEKEGVANVRGLQRFLKEKAEAGFRKVVLLPGCYRFSAAETLLMPGGLTVDMNGATFKENRFTGAHSLIVDFRNCRDAHLVNGTIEGDYWEHDYDGSPDGSEWPMGFRLTGEATYCSVENVTVKNITGYGIGTGINDRRDGHTNGGTGIGALGPGGLDPRTGVVDEKEAGRVTSALAKLSPSVKKIGSFSVSKYLGYQGRATRSWHYVVGWYDAQTNFLYSQTCWQYRQIHVPAKAAFWRMSLDLAKPVPIKETGLGATHFRFPWNCVVKKCTIDRARCVGIAPCAMVNLLFEDNVIVNCGESKAKCAFDAEDGWDMMIDTTVAGNWVHDNYGGDSLLTCAGHNFVFERNRCDFHLYGRTNSSCVRDNDVGRAMFYCDGRLRTGYGRFSGNRITDSLTLGYVQKSANDGWRITLDGLHLDGKAGKVPWISVCEGGQLVNSSFANMAVTAANLFNCSLDHCTGKRPKAMRWAGVRVKDCAYEGLWEKNLFSKCTFEGTKIEDVIRGGQSTFDGCTFVHTYIRRIGEGSLVFRNCKVDAKSFVKGNYWEKPANVFCEGCEIDTGDKPFCDVGAYTLGKFRFERCKVSGKSPLLLISDLRPQPTDNLPATVAVSNCAYAAAAPFAVGIHGGKSVKSVAITAAKNTFAKGTELLNKKAVQAAWKLDAK